MAVYDGTANLSGAGGLSATGALALRGAAALSGTGGWGAPATLLGNRIIGTFPGVPTSVFTNQNIAFLDARLPTLTAAVTGAVGGTGRVTASLPSPLTASFRAGVRISATLPSLTGNIVGAPAVVGRIDASLYCMRGVLAGTVTTIGRVSGRLYLPRSTITGYAGRTARIAATMRPLRGVFTGGAGATGTVVARLPSFTAELTGYTSVYGTVVATLPRPLTTTFTASATWLYVNTYVTNTTTFAPTTYTNYGFNSFTEVNGRFLAAKADGIYAVHEGDLDQTAAISASFATGDIDYQVRELKRLENVYGTYTTDGPIKISVTPDKGTTYAYRMNDSGGDFAQRRVTIGKGQRGRYWKIAVSNYNGEDFSFTSLDAVFVKTARRV